MTTTINESEIIKFTKISDQWWNKKGSFSLLHKINPLRVCYVANYLNNIFTQLSSLSLLDIGCGGGIFSESMSRLGIDVCGIDPSQSNINIAKNHALKNNLQINYRCIDIYDLINTNECYDIIVVMEVIEHVNNLPIFIQNVCQLLKNNGVLFLSTLNKTIKSMIFAIIAAEYILHWLPQGTHKWQKFVKPSQIVNMLLQQNVIVQDITGISFNVIKNKWSLSRDISVNYILTAQKII
ncbi:bifunctional 2-polyprenyl-6-hydroxyphenol methylase/3-demethylubiquinol 3-O-methyltransferase UbiG [Neoehrlichia mikurensis]|uniref:Ubiquinone biosynthesis O-methyltransferase n=1 Tax=Neoehrlichia mikurensis TaxID=89586 RepID=A0A9Q9BSB2_9RICK|nr:bifunctional 2-polyprenyl-6-hydroxyphenol methylase/3-demethylubiquinol 3-O-methyltransferase UbiG [Neoehrlichia mikurensis]QXK91959.1 bifunctional 2-polyprenyl-6-hydroxyphenol methylase/3-demethylubiquinol 3-O-methyltransferase UbiG [Neoehrlichia mikurensis]QXK93172.1 bifunctional 2-polyprenyl-6-hydroxyphenol methylase/3-demethylubiquinol 3-O-methyltransferase UbiG [Neoehrlichia mikurensis]QXK93651.1 bifunctional 2-polyprenyl-6-hydroxyphenol methylase/3-demethylubiquinol 3-O-methyltransferas